MLRFEPPRDGVRPPLLQQECSRSASTILDAGVTRPVGSTRCWTHQIPFNVSWTGATSTLSRSRGLETDARWRRLTCVYTNVVVR